MRNKNRRPYQLLRLCIKESAFDVLWVRFSTALMNQNNSSDSPVKGTMATDIAVHPEETVSFEPRWAFDKASTGASPTKSLNFALESSMKMWQPSSGRVMGDLISPPPVPAPTTQTHLSAALDFSWMDFPKPKPRREQSQFTTRVHDECSLSSGTGSRRGSSASLSGSFSGSLSGGSRRGSVTESCSGSGSPCRTPSPFGQSSTNASLPVGGTMPETYSRKVFVGGLPPDIDQDEIKEQFVRYGPLTVDWPHKAQSKAYFPPKGYAFLLFRDEVAVHRLVDQCMSEEGKYFTFVSSVTQTHKKVQIRPWKLSESDYIMDHTQPIDPRKTIFIGGVPRPLKAMELADIFNSRYGNVCYAGIDCDPELKYPKGAGRVTFCSRVSFMSAVSCRFLQVTYGDIDKKVEVKPYVLDDQMCDECHGLHCSGRYAPYFCGNIHCLRYYCEHCWASIHSAPGTQNHRCFIKENGDRPRAINFFPSQRSSVGLP